MFFLRRRSYILSIIDNLFLSKLAFLIFHQLQANFLRVCFFEFSGIKIPSILLFQHTISRLKLLILFLEHYDLIFQLRYLLFIGFLLDLHNSPISFFTRQFEKGTLARTANSHRPRYLRIVQIFSRVNTLYLIHSSKFQ